MFSSVRPTKLQVPKRRAKLKMIRNKVNKGNDVL